MQAGLVLLLWLHKSAGAHAWLGLGEYMLNRGRCHGVTGLTSDGAGGVGLCWVLPEGVLLSVSLAQQTPPGSGRVS